MKRIIKVKEVAVFKENYCDENQIIIEKIIQQIAHWFCAPILDVGYGTGDIAYYALYSKAVIGIDVNYADEEQYPLSPHHQRLQVDFFNYVSPTNIHTILISHTLQFLDSDIRVLNERINRINAKRIITITNDNTGDLGKILLFIKENYELIDPELNLDDFPKDYVYEEEVAFTATLSCPSYVELAEQIAYMMVISSSENWQLLEDYLRAEFTTPSIYIDQKIKRYERTTKE